MNEWVLFIVLGGSLLVLCGILNQIPDRYLSGFKDLHRQSPLDGLRGILATTIVSYHFYLNYFYACTGQWGNINTRLILNLGAVPVSLFFMITGFLFFKKILKPDINWRRLYTSRFRRILPLYYWLGFITALLFISDQHPIMTFAAWGRWIYSWLLFIDLHLPKFIGWNLVAGASWTLIYEWGFYFALPVLYWVIHGTIKQKITLFVSFLVFLQIFSRTGIEFYLLFVLALFSSGYAGKWQTLIQQYQHFLSVVAVILICYTLFFTDGYTLIQQVLLAVIFFLLANGVAIFGILNTKGLKILGELSYSIYLMHGIVLYIYFHRLKLFNFNQSIMTYYRLFPGILILVIGLSLMTYFWIERQFIDKKLL